VNMAAKLAPVADRDKLVARPFKPWVKRFDYSLGFRCVFAKIYFQRLLSFNIQSMHMVTSTAILAVNSPSRHIHHHLVY